MRVFSPVRLAAAAALVGVALMAAQAWAAEPVLNDDPLTSPRTEWFRDARFGMFIHWGIYAVPARAEWVMNNEKIPVKEYEKFAAEFNPVKFDAKAWVKVAKDAGMKYIVITSKHHDGFSMFDTKLNDYNVVKATPWHHDPMKDLAAACKEAGIKFCFYYSIMDWHEEGPLPPGQDYNNKPPKDLPKYIEYMKGELKELVTQYGPLGIMWFDGQWIPQWTPAMGKDLYAYVRGLQPDIIVNNRVGKGGFGDGDYETPEQHIPAGAIKGRLWETCMTLNNSWGFRKTDDKWKSATELTQKLIDISSKGGNFLLNVGPTAEGIIPPESVERLAAVGAWLKKNGEAIYGSSQGPWLKTPFDGRATVKGNTLYLHVFKWPEGGLTVTGFKAKPTAVDVLDKGVGAVTWKEAAGEAGSGLVGVEIKAPEHPDAMATVIAVKFAAPPVVVVTPAVEKQGADGSVTLKAADSEVHGSSAEYDQGRNAIVQWNKMSDWISWDIAIEKPGTFDVMLTASVAAESAGAEFELSVGDQKLAGKTASTGNWTTFMPVKVGTVKIEKAGKFTLSIKATTRPGTEVMKLRAVELKPAK